MAIMRRIVKGCRRGGGMLLFCIWCSVTAAPPCQSVEPSANDPVAIHSNSEWKEWDVLDARSGVPIGLDQWLETLSKYDVLFVGEEHHNQFHIEAALKILRSLVERDRHPVLALEMFGWDGQAALDHYITADHDQMSGPEFLAQSRWTQNWGGSFEDYAPLLDFARDHHLIVRAMNPPKSLIRGIVKKGLAGARNEPEWNHWGMDTETIVDDPLYREKILDQLRQCHGGGAPEDYETMYEASMVRDEAMAKTLVAAWKAMSAERSTRPIVSYTGGGHIQYKLPIPKRVARRLSDDVKQVTIYLTSFEPSRKAELQQYMTEGLADYLWLTPLGKQGPPRRCR